MKIAYINTQNKIVAKDMLIRTAIKLGLQYIEMPDEVIIDGTHLFRFLEKEEIHVNYGLIDILSKHSDFSELTIDNNFISTDNGYDFSRFKKNDYKLQSKQVKSKIKTKVNYNRRKY